jgi:hypothetical protein
MLFFALTLITAGICITSFLNIKEQVINIKRIDTMRVRAVQMQDSLSDIESLNSYLSYGKITIPVETIGERIAFRSAEIEEGQRFLVQNIKTVSTGKAVKAFNESINSELLLLLRHATREELEKSSKEVDNTGAFIQHYWEDRIKERLHEIEHSTNLSLIFCRVLEILAVILITLSSLTVLAILYRMSVMHNNTLILKEQQPPDESN